MNDAPYNYQHDYSTGVPQANNLALAGFVCSLVGLLLTGGLLCPIGVILSLIGLGREPRGLAVAGLVIGIVGSSALLLVMLLAGTAILAAVGLTAAVLALSHGESIELTGDMMQAAVAVEAYRQAQGRLPETLGELEISASARRDPWGHDYLFERIDGKPGFDLISPGADGDPGTGDDVRLTGLGERWKAEGLGVEVEEANGGRVRIRLGNQSFTAEAGSGGGRVTLDLGGRVIEIVGDERSGRIDAGSTNGPDRSSGDGAESPGDQAPEGGTEER